MDSGKEVTLDDGFRQLQIPLANQRFVRRIVDVIGIDRFVSTSTYLRAVRSDEGPDLRIAYGWTNGFVSRDEARHAAGDAQPRSRRPGSVRRQTSREQDPRQQRGLNKQANRHVLLPTVWLRVARGRHLRELQRLTCPAAEFDRHASPVRGVAGAELGARVVAARGRR